MNYSKSVIYTISKEGLVYVGSTTAYTKRKCQHKSQCNKNDNRKVYKLINENGGWDEFECKIYSEYPCDSKIKLVIEEERIRKLIGNLNAIQAHRTIEEKKEYEQTFYKTHKATIKEKRKVYLDVNVDKIQ